MKIVIVGIPRTGKIIIGNYFHDKRGFTYINMESGDNISEAWYLIISLDKFLFMTALAADKKPKYKIDLDLIVKKIFELQYKNFNDSKYCQDQLKEADF